MTLFDGALGFRVFRDREDAGSRLAERLLKFKDRKPVVLALPRGGVPVGLEIAKYLDAPLDLVFVRKIGAPSQPELAVGAVSDGGHPVTILNQDLVDALDLPESFIDRESRRQLEEIERRKDIYLGGRPRVDVKDRTAIVVDDGIATGATTRAALACVRRMQPARLVLAIPVAPPDSLDSLRADADEVICLQVRPDFPAVGAFYDDFRQVTDRQVAELMKSAPVQPSTTNGGGACS